jgi:hypothetical protein
MELVSGLPITAQNSQEYNRHELAKITSLAQEYFKRILR